MKVWELGGRWVGADGGDSGTVIRGRGGVGGVYVGEASGLETPAHSAELRKGFQCHVTVADCGSGEYTQREPTTCQNEPCFDFRHGHQT